MTLRPALIIAFVLIATAAVAAPAADRKSASQAYERARRSYYTLMASREKQRFRHHWLKAIAGFTAVATSYPDSREAASAIYTAGELWSDLHRISRRDSDLDQALVAYGRVAREHPGSSLADDALWQRARLQLRWRNDAAAAASALERLLARYPNGDMARRARELWPTVAAAAPKRGEVRVADDDAPGPLFGRREGGGTPPRVRELKHWSNSVYSRVVLYLSGPAQVRDESSLGGAAPELVIRLVGARLDDALRRDHPLDDALLKGIHFEPLPAGGVRLRAALKTAAQHRLMVLESPYRVVVDAFTTDSGTGALTPRPRRVALDPGHGGHDGGARATTGVFEKDIVLAIATLVEAALVERGVDVVLTRRGDTHVSLEERTAIANRFAADVFVSIHANAHAGSAARGVETYYLDTTDDAYSLRLAARENATQEEQVSDVQLVLADLATKVATREAKALAIEVQRQLVSKLRPLNPSLRDLGAKPSLFYVLLGARMPAILVETSFVTNPQEARLLVSAPYREAIAQAIARGIVSRLRGPLLVAQP